MVSSKTKCILKSLIIPILIAFCTIVVGVSVIEMAAVHYSQDLPVDRSVLDNSKWTQTTAYQSSCFALSPIFFTIIFIVGIVLGYYWFVKPCLVKEKTDNGDKS
jgi:hypothetical protein